MPVVLQERRRAAVITTVALSVVALTAAYFFCLGVLALVRPETAKAFLGSFAGSPRAHISELAVRIVVGVAFTTCSSRLRFPVFFDAFGWVLIATSTGLMMLPWRLHRRFAEWSVPRATQNMKLFAAGSLLAGCLLVWSWVTPPSPARVGGPFAPGPIHWQAWSPIG